MLSGAVAGSSFDVKLAYIGLTFYVFPVFVMTSCFLIMGSLTCDIGNPAAENVQTHDVIVRVHCPYPYDHIHTSNSVQLCN